MDVATPELRHLCDLKVELAPIMELGDAPRGRRRIDQQQRRI